MALGINITKDLVLSTYSDYDIYSFYLEGFEVGRPMLSPLRNENNPSFSVFQGDSELIWKDYGRSGRNGSGDCFSLVMDIYGLNSYSEAIQKVWSDLKCGHIVGTPQEIQDTRPKAEKKEHIIVVESKPMGKQELSYWNSFGIKNLDGILNPNRIWIDGNPVYTQRKKYGIIFAYEYYLNHLPYYKIYRPLSPDKSKKWGVNNVSNKCIDGIIKPRKKVIITKSRKDFRTLEVFLPDQIIAVQSENLSCFSDELMKSIINVTEEVYIWLDRDPTGIQNSTILAEKWGLKQIFTPDEVLPLNDPAGVRQKYGPKAIQKILKINGII